MDAGGIVNGKSLADYAERTRLILEDMEPHYHDDEAVAQGASPPTPEEIKKAKRREYYERNRDRLLAWQRKYEADKKAKKRQRQVDV